jgi:hypothetical protein
MVTSWTGLQFLITFRNRFFAVAQNDKSYLIIGYEMASGFEQYFGIDSYQLASESE